MSGPSLHEKGEGNMSVLQVRTSLADFMVLRSLECAGAGVAGREGGRHDGVSPLGDAIAPTAAKRWMVSESDMSREGAKAQRRTEVFLLQCESDMHFLPSRLSLFAGGHLPLTPRSSVVGMRLCRPVYTRQSPRPLPGMGGFRSEDHALPTLRVMRCIRRGAFRCRCGSRRGFHRRTCEIPH